LMGRTRWWEMTPLNELLSGCRREEVFCLARPGRAYLVYMTAGQDVSLDLSHVSSGTLRGEWWDPRSGEVHPAFDRPRFEARRRWGAASVREPVAFAPPDYQHDWALYLTAHPT
ncbi:MAG TPA: putative collagen-binding domain-containing protein, partial [Chloroflexota bacterium]|nr:putative collagen-binding domain-containing protein [Chloroflexota bacterium]